MAFTTLMQAEADGLRIRLIERGVASFALLFQDGSLTGIAYRSTDYAFACRAFHSSISLAERGLIAHPAWRRTFTRNVPINGERL